MEDLGVCGIGVRQIFSMGSKCLNLIVTFLLDLENLFLDSSLINVNILAIVDVYDLARCGYRTLIKLKGCHVSDFLLSLLDLRILTILVFEPAVI